MIFPFSARTYASPILAVSLCAAVAFSGAVGLAAEPDAADEPTSSEDFTPLLKKFERVKGQVTDLERERLALKEAQVFTSSELTLVLSQTASHPVPAWIRRLTIRLNGKPLGEIELTPPHLAILRDSSYLLLNRRPMAPGRHQLQLIAEGVDSDGNPRRQEARLDLEKGAGGLWADLHFLADAPAVEPLQVGIDQWGNLSPAVKKQKDELPFWQAELAMLAGDPLKAVSYYGLYQQRGLPETELVTLHFRMAEAYLAAKMPSHVVALISPNVKEAGGRESLEAWFYLLKAAYIDEKHRDVVKRFERLTPKLRVSMYHEALYLTGNSYLQLKEFERAFSTLSQIPRYSEFYPFAQYSMGLAYLNFGDVYSAVESFRRLASLEAGNNAVLSQLIDKANLTVGYEFLQQKRYTDAIGQFVLVHPESPLFDQALFGIGWGYFKMEEYVKAAVVFKDLRQRYPDSPYSQEALVALGVCYSRLQAFKLSIDHFRLALDSVTTMAQSIQERLDAIQQPDWVPPESVADFSVVSGLSSQVRLDDILKFFQQQRTLQAALDQYRELTQVVGLIDAAQRDLQEIAKSQAQWLSGQESRQRYTLLKSGFDRVEKAVGGLQHEFKQRLWLASTALLKREQVRLEETSVQASIGIARNLVLDTAGLQGDM